MDNENNAHVPHRTMFEIWTEFFMEIVDFFKYIFHDVWLGKNP